MYLPPFVNAHADQKYDELSVDIDGDAVFDDGIAEHSGKFELCVRPALVVLTTKRDALKFKRVHGLP